MLVCYVDPTGEGCSTVPDTPHHRALAESGWDNTTRFGSDASLVAPVDLNALLYRYERDLARLCAILGDGRGGEAWAERARQRRVRINELCWDEDAGWYHDVDLRSGRWCDDVPRSLASFVPLWAGVASQVQADRLVANLPLFEAAHGLTATEPWPDEGTEHSWPTGWAYSHWFVCEGLRNYGFRRDAQRIAMKWLRCVAATLAATGDFLERYNVVEPGGPTPGRYRPQPGFAWTNAVLLALVARILFDRQPDGPGDGTLPAEWEGARLDLPGYPIAATRSGFTP